MSAAHSKASKTHVALLRGINVGGRNKLPMKELVSLLEASGCADVRTYIQSGNAVFTCAASRAKALPGVIAAAIEAELGLSVPVVLRSAREMDSIIESSPFARPSVDVAGLHVGFLAAKPNAAAVAKLDPERSVHDELHVNAREIYLHLTKGVAGSKLTNAYFDRVLGTTSTMRNWKTACRLRDMACE